jgi:membrane peptidoglycan carboxypeptidase
VYSAKQNPTHVFTPSATFLMTDMLLDVVNNGTAKLLKKQYDVAAKTGTVGNKLGNTDALVAGYTTQHTFVVWHSGMFDNTISGANVPCKLASQLLDRIYQDGKPINFAPPNNVVKLTIDKPSLVEQQQLKLAHTGIDFWFDQTNKPTETIAETLQNYTIKYRTCENGIEITLPNISNFTWQLLQKIDDRLVNVPLENNLYIYQGNEDATFVARLYKDGSLLQETPSVNVYPIKPIDNEKEDKNNKGNILDFWYW